MASIQIKYVSLKRWLEISGWSRSKAYVEMSEGRLIARKFGKSLLIDYEAGLRYIENMPIARPKIGAVKASA